MGGFIADKDEEEGDGGGQSPDDIPGSDGEDVDDDENPKNDPKEEHDVPVPGDDSPGGYVAGEYEASDDNQSEGGFYEEGSRVTAGIYFIEGWSSQQNAWLYSNINMQSPYEPADPPPSYLPSHVLFVDSPDDDIFTVYAYEEERTSMLIMDAWAKESEEDIEFDEESWVSVSPEPNKLPSSVDDGDVTIRKWVEYNWEYEFTDLTYDTYADNSPSCIFMEEFLAAGFPTGTYSLSYTDLEFQRIEDKFGFSFESTPQQHIRDLIEDIARSLVRPSAQIRRGSFAKAKTPNRVKMKNISTLQPSAMSAADIGQNNDY